MTDEEREVPSNDVDDLGILTRVLTEFKKLDRERQERLLETITTFFGFSARPVVTRGTATLIPGSVAHNGATFSENRSLSPKEFLIQKTPRTDVERIATLAYYLTHYRDLPHFKTLDLSKLNTEAAQPKFANATWAANNAAKMGYLVPAGKGGARQLSALGEQFVQALPDREAAKGVMALARPRRRGAAKRSPAIMEPGEAEDNGAQ